MWENEKKQVINHLQNQKPWEENNNEVDCFKNHPL